MRLVLILFFVCYAGFSLAQLDTIKLNVVELQDTLGLKTTNDTLPKFIPDSTKQTIGIASFYHQKFNGRKTSSGEIFSNDKLTAAHKTIKLGTYVRIRCLKNDSTVIVKVNDRLPQNSKRSIDLTTRAAKQLNFIQAGLTKVEITVLSEKPIDSSENSNSDHTSSPINVKKQYAKHPHKKRNHSKRK